MIYVLINSKLAAVSFVIFFNTFCLFFNKPIAFLLWKCYNNKGFLYIDLGGADVFI